MTKQVTKFSVSPARQQLLEWLRNIYYGRIESLQVENGEPVLNPPPKIIHEHKIHGMNFPRPIPPWRDYLLKEEVVTLFNYLNEIGDGTIDRIDIQAGLPFRVTVSWTPSIGL